MGYFGLKPDRGFFNSPYGPFPKTDPFIDIPHFMSRYRSLKTPQKYVKILTYFSGYILGWFCMPPTGGFPKTKTRIFIKSWKFIKLHIFSCENFTFFMILTIFRPPRDPLDPQNTLMDMCYTHTPIYVYVLIFTQIKSFKFFIKFLKFSNFSNFSKFSIFSNFSLKFLKNMKILCFYFYPPQ